MPLNRFLHWFRGILCRFRYRVITHLFEHVQHQNAGVDLVQWTLCGITKIWSTERCLVALSPVVAARFGASACDRTAATGLQ